MKFSADAVLQAAATITAAHIEAYNLRQMEGKVSRGAPEELDATAALTNAVRIVVASIGELERDASSGGLELRKKLRALDGTA